MKKYTIQIQKRLHKVIILTVVAILSLTPLMLVRHASALQLTSRSLSIATARPSATSVQYTFNFSLATLTGTSDVEGIMIQACTTAVGTCSGTAGTDIPNVSGVTFVSQNGNWQGATNFAVDGTGANDCLTSTTRSICLKRTDATNQTTSTSRQIVLGGITNQSTANSTFFMRITTYDNNTWSSSGGAGNLQLDTGTVASAVTQTLTINAQVAEVLNFCTGTVGSALNNATSSIASDCSGVSGTTVNIGTLDTSQVNISPVSTNGGNDKVGVAMLRTNAGSGATVSYKAVQQSGSNHVGALRISGSTNCSAVDGTPGTDVTDECINSAGTTQTAFSAGTEKFGMTLAGVNCGSTTSYSCVFTSSTNHLTRNAQYDGSAAATYGSSAATGFAWDETGTAAQVASSSTVVDDEVLMMHFAATPSITTPFGVYGAQADFIAVPTY